MKRELSQQEIDAVFQGSASVNQEARTAVQPFDFSRLDRIPKSQIRAVHQLHENFSRNSASSLSAYLRAYVGMSLISLEQISYAEFLAGLSSPTFIAYVGLRPYDGTAVLELNPSLVFTFVEMLLGGGGKMGALPLRKVTEIEKNLMQNLLRILLQNLSEAWSSVTDIRFAVQSLTDEPQVLHVLAPTEAVVAISIEVRVGTMTGMMNLAIPSIFIKRLRHMFERLRRVHRAESKRSDQMHMAALLAMSTVNLEARLDGPTISTSELLSIEAGDVLMLEYPLNQKLIAKVNGQPRFWGDVEQTGNSLGFRVSGEHEPD
jgi:flagellar motor switch protein FliM